MTSLFSFLKKPIKADSVFFWILLGTNQIGNSQCDDDNNNKNDNDCQALCEHNSQNLCNVPIIIYLVSTLVIFLIAVTKYPDKGNLWRVWHVHHGRGFGGCGWHVHHGGGYGGSGVSIMEGDMEGMACPSRWGSHGARSMRQLVTFLQSGSR